MMPGGMDPRKMKALMKQMGISQEELRGVTEVIIRLRDKEIHFSEPQVTEVRAQGTRSYQIQGGKPQERPLGAGAAPSSVAPGRGKAPPEPSEFPEEDVKLVMEQAGCERDSAIEALRAADGSPAEAILSLMG